MPGFLSEFLPRFGSVSTGETEAAEAPPGPPPCPVVPAAVRNIKYDRGTRACQDHPKLAKALFRLGKGMGAVPETATLQEYFLMIENLRHWTLLEHTDERYTKQFSRAGGFKGTDINPTYRWKRMTEIFGPAGVGWGTCDENIQIVPGIDSEQLVYVTCKVWIQDPDTGEKHVGPMGAGGDYIVKWVGKDDKRRLVSDDEALKKATTDAIGNACRFFGLAADVYLGLFDDSKYREENRERFEEAERQKVVAENPELAALLADAKKSVAEFGKSKPGNKARDKVKEAWEKFYGKGNAIWNSIDAADPELAAELNRTLGAHVTYVKNNTKTEAGDSEDAAA